MDDVDEKKGGGGDNGGGGDGKYPGPDDASSDTPADSGQAMYGSYADDGAGDGVSGADWDAGQSGAKQSDGSGAFCAETAEGLELGDLLSHGADDAPAAKIRS